MSRIPSVPLLLYLEKRPKGHCNISYYSKAVVVSNSTFKFCGKTGCLYTCNCTDSSTTHVTAEPQTLPF